MEIGIASIVLFVASFAFLFFAPGYALLCKKKCELGELIAKCFVVSSAVVLAESLLLATTVGLSLASLVVLVGATICVISFFSSA